MARWFRLSLTVTRPFVCGCLISSTMLRFHTPLIKPDVRIARIRLSDKGSRVRSRKVTLDPTQSDQTELKVEVFGREP